MKTAYSRITNRVLPFRFTTLLLAAGLAAATSGCLQPGTGSTSFQNTAGNTSTIPGGPKAAQVIFTDLASTGAGSFNTPSAAGTLPGSGNGLQAVQLFNPDGSRLTQTSTGGTSDPNWPTWLKSVEIGISGASNTVATNTNCANFGTGTAVCGNLPSGSANCDVANTYGISEKFCDGGSAATWGSGNGTGNGTQTDGVYIRANFNRANLGSSENIMVVVNYAASAFNAATASPSTCFSAGSVPFAPENCADFTWRVFETYGPTHTWVQPFLMLVPPMYSYVNGNTKTASTTTETKQFILPFAGDANLSTIVLGRTGAQLNSGNATFTTDCAVTGGSGGSPLCAGIVFYSMTFFRI